MKDWAATTPLAATRKLLDTFVDLQLANAKIDVQGWCPVRQADHADLGTSSEASKLSSWQRVLGGIHTDTHPESIHFASMFDNKWYIIDTV